MRPWSYQEGRRAGSTVPGKAGGGTARAGRTALRAAPASLLGHDLQEQVRADRNLPGEGPVVGGYQHHAGGRPDDEDGHGNGGGNAVIAVDERDGQQDEPREHEN